MIPSAGVAAVHDPQHVTGARPHKAQQKPLAEPSTAKGVLVFKGSTPPHPALAWRLTPAGRGRKCMTRCRLSCLGRRLLQQARYWLGFAACTPAHAASSCWRRRIAIHQLCSQMIFVSGRGSGLR